MTDIEDSAAQAVVDASGRLERRLRPAFFKAVMRLAGNALAIATDHNEAAETHVRLSHYHATRNRGAR